MSTPQPTARRALPLAALLLLALLAFGALFAAPGFAPQPPMATPSPAPQPGQGKLTLLFAPQQPAAGYETAAPLRVTATLPSLLAGDGAVQINEVTLQLLDASGQPAMFGGRAGEPEQMAPQLVSSSQAPIWVADMSTPTLPGIYHVRVVATAPGAAAQYYEAAQPALTVYSPGAILASGFVYPRAGNLWVTAQDGTRTRKLTFYPSDQPAGEPSWSADGALIAYSSQVPAVTGQLPTSDIRVYNTRSGEDHVVVTHRAFEGLSYPTWGANGSVLFTADALVDPATGAPPDNASIALALEFWTVDRANMNGGPRSSLVRDAVLPDMSRDGKTLTYVSRTGDATSENAQVQTAIMVADAAGNNQRTLVPPGKYLAVYRPRVSPDGKLVAFAAINADEPTPDPSSDTSTNAWDIYVVPVSGGEPRRVTTLNTNQAAASWGSDSTRLAVLAGGELYIVPLAGGDPQPIAQVQADGDLSWLGR